MSNINNPGAGGGGGSGTVTSVAGGTGITNSPEPIVGAGTVNLDIDSLTTESTLANGDLFAFVDVSAGGTAIANQRKVTLADIATFVGGGGGGATCATAPELLCLDGRTGTTNDPTISSDAAGSIYGTAETGAAALLMGLHLNSKEETTLGPFSVNSINANTTTMAGFSVLLEFGNFQGPIILNDDATGGNAGILGFGIGGTWEVHDDSLGGPSAQVFSFNPTIQNDPGVAKSLASGLAVFSSAPTLLADGAACTLATLMFYQSKPEFETANGGALAIGDIWHHDIFTQADAGCAFTQHNGIQYDGIQGAGTVENDAAFICTDGDVIGSVSHISFISQGPIRELRHRGPAVFGANTNSPPTNASVGLELNSTDHAFLPSRLTDAQEGGLTLLDGMIWENSDQTLYRGVLGGAVVTFITADAAGDVTVPGKLTVVGSIDPTDLTMPEQGVNPPDPTTDVEFRLYQKGKKIVFQFNDAGTVRYVTYDLTQSITSVWATSTSAP